MSPGKCTMSLTVALPSPPSLDDLARTLFVQQLDIFCVDALVSRILVLYQTPAPYLRAFEGVSDKVKLFRGAPWSSGQDLMRMLECLETDHLMLIRPGDFIVQIPHDALKRLWEVATEANAGIVYSDLREGRDDSLAEYPLAEYQLGSVSETFDFGALVVISRKAVRRVLNKYGPVDSRLTFAGFYDLRLKLATDFPVTRIPEPLYCRKLLPTKSTPFLTDVDRYLGPKNRAFHREMEQTLTDHLRRIGAYLEPVFAPLPAHDGEYRVMASIVVPVRNREKTIVAAIESALAQIASFAYNIIVVDDHSTDGTTEILQQLARKSPSLIHLIPERTDLGIGGLWNHAVYSAECGLYAVQLDSDDVYSDPHALAKLIGAFYESPTDVESALLSSTVPRYAMVIGSYTTVDFQLKEVPPGLVDHHEWTRDNGRNNALRITGLGAPRAFYVPVLRRFGFINSSASSSEDYAVGLLISREYEIGRCYQSLYLARRWDENSDRTLPLGTVKGVEFKRLVSTLTKTRPDFLEQIWPIVLALISATKNRFEFDKDWLRTIEIRGRQKWNQANLMKKDAGVVESAGKGKEVGG